MNQINGLYAYRNQMYAQNQPKKPGKNDRPEGPMGPNGAPAEPTSISDETVEKFKARVREKVESGEINKTQDTEVQLSDKAKALLEELKQKYDNIDFFVADYSSDEEAQSYLDRGTKEYSVLIDPETLEAMAADEETKEKYTGMIDEATAKLADMKDQLEESGVQVKSLGVSIADDGSMTLFASIEEMSAKREEHLEKMREKKAAEKEKAEKADEEKAEEEDAAKKPDDKPPFMMPVTTNPILAARQKRLPSLLHLSRSFLKRSKMWIGPRSKQRKRSHL